MLNFRPAQLASGERSLDLTDVMEVNFQRLPGECENTRACKSPRTLRCDRSVSGESGEHITPPFRGTRIAIPPELRATSAQVARSLLNKPGNKQPRNGHATFAQTGMQGGRVVFRTERSAFCYRLKLHRLTSRYRGPFAPLPGVAYK